MISPPILPLDARDVKSRADFFAIASQYTRLRRSGRQFVGLCPFHSERHPSFYVHPEKKIFYCFGCGAGGDLFSFVMRAESCDFSDALRIVASWGSPRERASEARSRFRAGVGAKPLAPRSGAACIARKPEPKPRAIPGLGDWPSLACAAEREAEAVRGADSFT
jgi:CHC2 zinc finger